MDPEVFLSFEWASGSKYPDDWGRMYSERHHSVPTPLRTIARQWEKNNESSTTTALFYFIFSLIGSLAVHSMVK